jgi:hypothetical protein
MFEQLGEYIRKYGSGSQSIPARLSSLMHRTEGFLRRSIADLVYQVQVLDLMRLDSPAKVQITVGESMAIKQKALRFVKRFELCA